MWLPECVSDALRLRLEFLVAGVVVVIFGNNGSKPVIYLHAEDRVGKVSRVNIIALYQQIGYIRLLPFEEEFFILPYPPYFTEPCILVRERRVPCRPQNARNKEAVNQREGEREGREEERDRASVTRRLREKEESRWNMHYRVSMKKLVSGCETVA